MRDCLQIVARVAAPFPARLGVAVSGGADSVFLLHALAGLGRAAAVLHVNHHLRAEQSDADEAFVRELGSRFGLPVRVHHASGGGENLEQEARRARYTFFADAMAAGDCEAVATGHTLDDQAETVFYRFVRGAGTAGLSGIRPRTQAGIMRPLLDLTRAEIREWLTERGLTWREDESNRSPTFARNRIRHKHLPELAADLNPALPEVLANTARWAQGEEEFWEAELDRIAEKQAGHVIAGSEMVLIRTDSFGVLPAAVQRRLLRRAVEHVRASLRSIDFRHIEAIRGLMGAHEGSGRVQIPGLDIYRSFDWLRLAPPGYDNRVARDFEIPLQIPGLTVDNTRGFTIGVELVQAMPVYNNGVNGLDWERCAGSLMLRNWRPGDRFQPRGRSSFEKIKTLFQEHRIPLWERRKWPVIVLDDAILWARKFGVGSEFAARPESRTVLTIRDISHSENGESNLVRPASMELKRAPRPESGERGAEVL